MTARILCWFSCGAASAVATKLAIEENARSAQPLPLVVARCFVAEEHPDNDRFAADCAKWFGQPIVELKNEKYEGSIYETFKQRKYIAGIAGAPCTKFLKKEVRQNFEQHGDIQVFGYTAEEQDRVDRFIDGNAEVRLWPILIEKGLMHSDCVAMVARAGIDIPMMYKLGYRNNNCFAGDTAVITPDGYKTLKECNGQTVSILSDGEWREGVGASFGEQPITKLTLDRNGKQFEYFVTPDHEWMVQKNWHTRTIKKTSDLAHGDSIPVSFALPECSPDNTGILHGFVFGDGCSDNFGKQTRANFCGIKKELIPLFEFKNTPRPQANGTVVVHGLDPKFKRLPALQNTPSYLLGFLVGLIASDGCVSKTGIQVHNKSRETIDAVAEIARSIGLFVGGIDSTVRTTNYAIDAPLSKLLFTRGAFKREWLIRSDQNKKWPVKTTRPKAFKVVSVVDTGRREEVFCLTVPGTHSFTLKDGALTRNCIGCVKGGAGYWNKIRVDFPAQFNRMATFSKSLGVRLVKYEGERVFLADLPPTAGDYPAEPEIQCGIFCEMAEREIAA